MKRNKQQFLQMKMPLEKLVIGGKLFNLKVAYLKKHREKGLQGINKLPKNGGLFFWYGERREPKTNNPLKRAFVSMCIEVNLTVLFLNKSGCVVCIFYNLSAEPKKDFAHAGRYYCPQPADLMIELPGNIQLRTKVGDKIAIKPLVRKIKRGFNE